MPTSLGSPPSFDSLDGSSGGLAESRSPQGRAEPWPYTRGPLQSTSERIVLVDEAHKFQTLSSDKRSAGNNDKLSTTDKVAIGAGVAALAGGIGAVVYSHWDDIKRFFKWGQLASGAVEDSAVLLETKLDHALALCKESPVDLDTLRSSIAAANHEARKLVTVNKQLRDRLDELRATVQTGQLDVK